MLDKTSSFPTRGSPPPTPPTDAAARTAPATLLQAPRTGIKRDGAAAGLPERAGGRYRSTSTALQALSSPVAESPGTSIAVEIASPASPPRQGGVGNSTSDSFASPVMMRRGFLTTTPLRPAWYPEAHAMLVQGLNRPDLFALVTQLDEHLAPGTWAFTGSVALQLHGMALEQDRGRQPVDADIEIDQFDYRIFTEQVRCTPEANGVANALQRGSNAAGGQEEYYVFGNGLKVDLLWHKSQVEKGGLRVSERPRLRGIERPRRRVSVSGIPVLSLAELKWRKQDYTDKPTAARDLERINTLMALHAAAAAQPAALLPVVPVSGGSDGWEDAEV